VVGDFIKSYWHHKNVWIIGASSGIGAQLAHELYAQGAELTLSSRRINLLQLLKQSLIQDSASESRIKLFPLDVTDPRQCHDITLQLKSQWDHLDTCIIVAGQYLALPASELNPDTLKLVTDLIDVNLYGPLRVLSEVIPWFMSQSYGQIGLVSSVAGYGGLPHSMAYSSSKAALNNLGETLSIDLHPYGIHVSYICPGFVDTPMTAERSIPMPAMISANSAARQILKGLENKQIEIHFPKRFTIFLKILRLLPRSWYVTLFRFLSTGTKT